jgi:hypothetical protein
MNVVAKIKARVGLSDIAAIPRLEFPSRIGRKFCNPFSGIIAFGLGSVLRA